MPAEGAGLPARRQRAHNLQRSKQRERRAFASPSEPLGSVGGCDVDGLGEVATHVKSRIPEAGP